jgi:hypothetical protein
MYKEVLRSISDVSIFPVIAFVMFFTFFILLTVYVFKMDKKEVSVMAGLPLESDSDGQGSIFSDHQPAKP